MPGLEARGGGGGWLERCAFGALLALALSFGLGDISDSTAALNAVVLHGVQALVPLSIALTLSGVLAGRRWPAFPRGLVAAVAAWLAVLVASALLAPTNREEALASVTRPISGALLAWAVCNVCSNRERCIALARSLVLGGLVIAAVGLAEALNVFAVGGWLATLHDGGPVPIGDVPRVAATLSHPNLASMLLELILPLAVAWVWTTSRHWRWPLTLSAMVILAALVLTFSRAGIGAAVFALGVLAALSVAGSNARRRTSLSVATRDGRRLSSVDAASSEQRRLASSGVPRISRPGRRSLNVASSDRCRLASLGIVSLALPVAVVCAAIANPGLERRLVSGLDEASAAQPSRLSLWSAGLAMLRDHPLLGVGPDNYRWRFAAYSGLQTNNLGVHAHDQYLEIAANTGVLGLITSLWLFGQLVRVAATNLRSGAASADWPWRAALLASLAAWLLHAVVDDFDRFWPTNVLFWLVAGLSLRFSQLETAHRVEQTLGRVAFAYEAHHARSQRLVAFFWTHAQRQHLTPGVGQSQAVDLAGRAQARQIPVEQHDARPRGADVVDQSRGVAAVGNDADARLVFEQQPQS